MERAEGVRFVLMITLVSEPRAGFVALFFNVGCKSTPVAARH